MLGALVDLLAPPACVACRQAGVTPLCAPCRRSLTFLAGQSVCPRCALPVPCGGRRRPCPAAGAPWRAAFAPVAYAGSAPALVAALKFRGALQCAELMAAQITAAAPAGLLDDGTVLVPVPTHPTRARGRGFDQAVVLARQLGRRTGLVVCLCLRRTGARTRQLGAGRDERRQADRLQLHCRGLAPRRVVLVDDVHTTGATLRAAATAVRAAGAQDVAAVTWARTL